MLRVAVIPTYNRPQVCLDAIESIRKQVDLVYVIDDGEKEPMPYDTENAWRRYYVEPYEGDEHPSNLSKIWNQGLNYARQEAGGSDYDVIVINDDVVVPDGWVEAVSDTMRAQNAAAGCSGPHDVVLWRPGPVTLSMRMQGWAFMLAGEKGLRVDERFQWWFGDSDLDWQAREAGGMAMVRGFTVPNRFANQSTNGVRAEQANEDGRRFEAKWGMKAW